jgi:hypothetical protein
LDEWGAWSASLPAKEESVDRPVVQLVGQNGNVFNIIALCKVAARKAGWSKERIDAFVKDMMSRGSYDDVLVGVMEHFDVE